MDSEKVIRRQIVSAAAQSAALAGSSVAALAAISTVVAPMSLAALTRTDPGSREAMDLALHASRASFALGCMFTVAAGASWSRAFRVLSLASELRRARMKRCLPSWPSLVRQP